jgi:hypothetical protein
MGGISKKETMRTLETGVLFSVAVDAASGIKAPLRAGGQRAALTSIVFSVVALEAFMNEMTEYANESVSTLAASVPPEVKLFAQVMTDAEESRAKFESKLSLGKWILSGKNLDRGAQPYQDLGLLIRLRNDLVHFKPNDRFVLGTPIEEGHKALIQRFGNKNILANNKSMAGDWTYLVQTKAVAEWSCRTAAQVVRDFCFGTPQSGFESVLNFLLGTFESSITILDAMSTPELSGSAEPQ